MRDPQLDTTTFDFVATCPLFQGLDRSRFETLRSRLVTDRYAAGEAIYNEGDSRQQMAIIVSGQCEVVKQDGDGTRQLAVLDPPTAFGELSFFHPAPHSATVRALSDTVVLALSRTSYDELLEADPLLAHGIAVNTIKLISDRLRRMDEWVFELLDQPDAAVHKEEWQDFRSKLYTDWQF